MRMHIAQSSISGQWGYCPDGCPLCKLAAYADEPTGYLTAEAAQAAAAADPSLAGYSLTFRVVPARPPYKLSRGMRGALEAESVIPLGVDSRELRVHTYKSAGGLVCVAQVVKSSGDGCYSYVIHQDYSAVLAQGPGVRALEKNIRAMHEGALAGIAPTLAAAAAQYAPKVAA